MITIQPNVDKSQNLSMEERPAVPWTVRDAHLAYVSLRVLFGLNLLMHGLARWISGPDTFIAKTVRSFDGTVLPPTLVQMFAATVIPVEMVLGILILVGLAPRVVGVLAMAWMAALTFGSSILQEWAVTGLQLTYGLTLFVLILFANCNAWSVEALRPRGKLGPGRPG